MKDHVSSENPVKITSDMKQYLKSMSFQKMD